MIPGRVLHRIAATVCSNKALTDIVEPALADFQAEYAGASRERRLRILAAGYPAMVEVMAMALLESSTTHDERRTMTRMFAWGGGVALTIAGMVVGLVLATFEP